MENQKWSMHGDVLFIHGATIPGAATKDDKFKGTVQDGEHTGHAHRLQGNGFEMYNFENKRYLRLLAPTPIRHEEHHEIMLPEGDHEIRIVREKDWFDDMVRPVID